ncbi:MAG: polyhydroxyalkanoate synthesis regulator DNA-binding domain-containing protein [Acidobacteria bacterium]|nr:polyhydroxyalkanoate synthesis regulator DNA-binding domain-containing protein [Acidobacteriota bacterium]MCB9397272.1 polyhydroxyalkanoate synthesis regulator DNA-binding domain-containing protein [Acidobacteriota bacterium]
MHIIKRYGNRKLYDTEKSRYVALADVAALVREGHQVQVLDAQNVDITAQILAQIIVEEQKGEGRGLSVDLLHDLVRAGGEAVTQKVRHVQAGVEHWINKSLERINPVREAKREMAHLKERLEQLEASIEELEQQESPRQSPK